MEVNKDVEIFHNLKTKIEALQELERQNDQYRYQRFYFEEKAYHGQLKADELKKEIETLILNFPVV